MHEFFISRAAIESIDGNVHDNKMFSNKSERLCVAVLVN